MTPYDELLFEHEMNYPNETGFYDGIDILFECEEKEDIDYFFKSEENINLTAKYVRSRYDMSLLLLRREWEMSWKPESHLSFHSPYRQALQTMTLIAHRHGFPLDLCRAVNSFLPRDWWYDQRRNCWKYECQISSVQNKLDKNQDRHGKKKHVICSSCMLVSACSIKHLNIIHHEGHRRPCGLPPMRIPTKDDICFCDTYWKNCDQNNNVFEDNDDWESDDSASNPDLHGTRTYKIQRYFNKHSYRSQKRQSFAFERYYSEE